MERFHMDCPCKEDKDHMQALGEAIEKGLFTMQETGNIYHSRHVWGTHYRKWRDICPAN